MGSKFLSCYNVAKTIIHLSQEQTIVISHRNLIIPKSYNFHCIVAELLGFNFYIIVRLQKDFFQADSFQAWYIFYCIRAVNMLDKSFLLDKANSKHSCRIMCIVNREKPLEAYYYNVDFYWNKIF